MLHAWLNVLCSTLHVRQGPNKTAIGRFQWHTVYLLCSDLQYVGVDWLKWSSLIMCYSRLSLFMCIAIAKRKMPDSVWVFELWVFSGRGGGLSRTPDISCIWRPSENKTGGKLDEVYTTYGGACIQKVLWVVSLWPGDVCILSICT